MLTKLENLPPAIVGIRASGKVTRQDYERVLVPLLEDARTGARTRLRLLLEFSPEFTRVTIGAALDELRIGVKYHSLLEKCAVIADKEWVAFAARLFGSLHPCPTKAFRTGQIGEALAWLGDHQSDSKLQLLLKENGVAVVHPHGPLRREDFEKISAGIDPWIETHHKLQGLVVSMKKFPGWENVGSFVHHLEFVRGHHRKIRKVALAADGFLPALAGRIAKHFVKADIKQFPYDEVQEAENWAQV